MKYFQNKQILPLIVMGIIIIIDVYPNITNANSCIGGFSIESFEKDSFLSVYDEYGYASHDVLVRKMGEMKFTNPRELEAAVETKLNILCPIGSDPSEIVPYFELNNFTCNAVNDSIGSRRNVYCTRRSFKRYPDYVVKHAKQIEPDLPEDMLRFSVEWRIHIHLMEESVEGISVNLDLMRDAL